MMLTTQGDTYGGQDPPTNQQPIIWQANDFTTAPLFRGNINNGATTVTEIPDAWLRKTRDPAIPEQYCWNLSNNELGISTYTGYLPLKAYYRFRFHWVIPGMLDPQVLSDSIVKFRIDFFTMKQGYVHSNQKNYQMPQNVGAFRRLCDYPQDQYSGTQAGYTYLNSSAFNPEIHRVLKTVHVKIKDKNLYDKDSSSSQQKYVAVECPIRQEFIKLDAHQSIESNNLWSQMPENRVVWCMITTNASQNMLTDFQMRILCERTLVWRDGMGAAT